MWSKFNKKIVSYLGKEVAEVKSKMYTAGIFCT